MNTVTLCALAALALLIAVAEQAAATEVEVCGVEAAKRRSVAGADSEVDLKDTEHITISNCEKPPCRLRRKSTTYIQFKFTPDKEVKTLRNEVNAKILGIPFPFLGVDNTNACGNIFLADGTTKAPCPLQAGVAHVYKNQFDILEIYPKVKVQVHWALVSQNNDRVMCFNVPAKITS